MEVYIVLRFHNSLTCQVIIDTMIIYFQSGPRGVHVQQSVLDILHRTGIVNCFPIKYSGIMHSNNYIYSNELPLDLISMNTTRHPFISHISWTSEVKIIIIVGSLNFFL